MKQEFSEMDVILGNQTESITIIRNILERQNSVQFSMVPWISYAGKTAR
eukprot:CAMPEP_0172457314 /NCGR_PEP_ID=MMETSP1065-20121228/21332_1 /TAXON_ID=265537 /ORGANISM="Amphiprora paludosa, Strain CCMP125" /LENGTH=48 /DNA_ID= /DNA_START= /DNA_END= /DNA_ORIENTATION=